MGNLVFQATLGGQVNLVGPNTASTYNLNVPAVSSTIATTSGTETLTNKTLTNPVINGFTGDTSVVNIGSGQFYKDTSGNLGLGTSSPGSKLDILNTTTAQAQFSYNSTIFGRIGRLSSGNYEFSAYENGANLIFGTSTTNGSTTERMRLDSSGNMGLGVTPSAWGGSLVAIQSGPTFALGSNTTSAFISYNQYYNGTNNIYLRSDYANRMQMDSGAFKFYTAPSGTAGNTITFTQAMTLDASGNLRLGTTTDLGAADRLTVVGGNFAVQRTSGITTFMGDNTQNGYAGTITNHAFALLTNSTERARIDSSGNLLVGTTSTTIGTANFGFKVQADGLTTWSRNVNGSSAVAQIYGNAGEFRLYGNGNAQNTNNSYGAISDIKLKENITDATPKLAQLQQVRVVNYNLIGSEVKQIGVIAQELEQVFPSMIEETQDYDADGNDLGTTTKGVKYSVFVPMLIKAIQELKAEFDAYKATHP